MLKAPFVCIYKSADEQSKPPPPDPSTVNELGRTTAVGVPTTKVSFKVREGAAERTTDTNSLMDEMAIVFVSTLRRIRVVGKILIFTLTDLPCAARPL